MSARDKDTIVALRLNLSLQDANTLRRASLVLHRWAELECGNSNSYGAWMIERDETTDRPYMVNHHYRHGQGQDTVTRTPIADREAGALKRIASVCKANGLYFYHQTDPRGTALYVAREPLTDNNYSTLGVGV